MHAWTVPGVVNNGTFVAVFACTNTLSSTVIVGVEAFDPAGGAALNDASATSLAVAPGGTGLFGTALLPGFAVDRNLAVPAFDGGSARILATTRSNSGQQILCTAFLADRSNNPPISVLSLPVIRRTTQQGD